MKERISLIVRPSSLVIFLLLVVLSLAAAPVAAQAARPICSEDPSVFTPSWDSQATSPATFTMTKDCQMMSGANPQLMLIRTGKNFTIDGAGFTIYAATKSTGNQHGTVFGFDSGSNTSLTLRNLTIEGGGTATGASRAGNDPDPAIIVKDGTLVLQNVTIQNTRGGAIRVINTGTVTLKDSTFTGNQVSGAGSSDQGTVVEAFSGSTVNWQGALTINNNTGGETAFDIEAGATFDISAVTCLSETGNQDASGANTILRYAPHEGFRTEWFALPRQDSCPSGNRGPSAPSAPSAPSGGSGGPSGGGTMMSMGDGDKRAMNDSNYGRRIAGMIGSGSAYYRINSGGVVTLQIYRVDGNSVGHWVMNVPQTAVDALGGPGCVASSPDGRYAVRVWADGNVTVSDGPDHENKVLHNTLQGGVSGMVIATETTYSTTPPGMGCPGYIG